MIKLLGLLLLFVGIAFVALNAQPITINYFLGAQTLPLAAALLIAFAMGVFLTFIVMKAKLKKDVNI
jgi:uncharacterized integral membrane protein